MRPRGPEPLSISKIIEEEEQRVARDTLPYKTWTLADRAKAIAARPYAMLPYERKRVFPPISKEKSH